jgi:hypothetical protein
MALRNALKLIPGQRKQLSDKDEDYRSAEVPPGA